MFDWGNVYVWVNFFCSYLGYFMKIINKKDGKGDWGKFFDLIVIS